MELVVPVVTVAVALLLVGALARFVVRDVIRERRKARQPQPLLGVVLPPAPEGDTEK